MTPYVIHFEEADEYQIFAHDELNDTWLESGRFATKEELVEAYRLDKIIWKRSSGLRKATIN